ncbi:tail sheath monomer [Synechococcus phage S-CAM3]|uniref:Tail sheath monomer n=1 Tax=Synechococcus phage S-CAM3 TaxID=1883366 RepID=A0A1D8KJN8_9CAUD|nr:tail sheath [Synechococcus phage S-CAM3]AOV58641.1 tail sheath monomer [Synechococcus phage S-CAM3]AOV58880.1 tail sheath monomer [Synechococcus phage S-CAM3]AOV59119.1 tail sheath monomer [Synechococcus phage S-CAM3]
MASQVSPGIVLKERDLSNAVIVGASTITAGVASTFQKGPIGKPTNISSQKELLAIFGAPAEENAEDWFVASEFLNYGGRLNVVRASTGVNSATDTGASVVVKNDEDWQSGNGSGNFLVARTAGTWANGLKVVFVDRGADQYVTLSNTPATIAMGDTLTFVGGKTGSVYSWDAASKTAAVILDDPSSRLTTADALDSPETGIAATLGTFVAGTGYQSAAAVAASGGTGAGLTIDTTVSVGEIVTFGAGPGGSSYITQNNLNLTGGTGTGATVNVTAVGGSVSSIAIADAGTGYTVGDVLTVDAGDSNATLTVSTVEGGVTSAVVNNAGVGYVVGDVLTISGGGGDATFEIATVVDGQITISAVRDWYTTTEISGTGLTLSSIGPRPGTSQFASEKGLKYDEIHAAVIDVTGNFTGAANTVVERILYGSKLTDGRSSEGASNYFKDLINDQSVAFFNGTAPAANWNPSSTGAGSALGVASSTLSSGDAFQLVGKSETAMAGGADDYAYTAAEIETAFDEFADTELVEINFLLMGGSLSTEIDTKAKANKVLSIASARKDCVAFVSPHKANQVGTAGVLTAFQQKENTLNFFNGMTSTSYAVFDSGYKYYYDRFNDKYRYIPCNGDVAGLCVNTSTLLDDWYSPAGVNRGSLRNAIKLAYNPSKADRDELYQARINPVVIFPGSGVTLFGDKTALASPSAFDRINVRRLFLNLEKRVGDLAKQVLFEQNDATTRSSFASAVNSYLSEVQARRGVTDFLVVCDESNNTPDVIDRNEFVAELFIKPTRSINYITVTFTATKTGVSFAEVVGR